MPSEPVPVYWCEGHGTYAEQGDRSLGCLQCRYAKLKRERAQKVEARKAFEAAEDARVAGVFGGACGILWAGCFASGGKLRGPEDVRRLFRLAVREALEDEEKLQEATCPLR